MDQPVTVGYLAFAVVWICVVVVGIQVFAPRIERWWQNRRHRP